MDSTRTFVAIEVGEPARSFVQRLIQRLETQIEGVRWTLDEHFHLTIKFLGDVDNRDLPRVCDEMRSACSGLAPFEISLAELGTFPLGRPPRVIWAGIEEGCEQLQQLHQRLDEGLADLGVPREGRQYTPHLTLGRIGRGGLKRRELGPILEDHKPSARIYFQAEQILLMASFREHGKLIYKTMDRVDL